MGTPSSTVAKAAKNEPRDPQSRLYREIGISAVAAALEPANFQLEANAYPVATKHVAAKAARGVRAA